MNSCKKVLIAMFVFYFLNGSAQLQSAVAAGVENSFSIDKVEIVEIDLDNEKMVLQAEEIFKSVFGCEYEFKNTMSKNEMCRCYVACYEKNVVAIMIIDLVERIKLIEINFLFVNPSFIKCGIGSYMLTFLKNRFVEYAIYVDSFREAVEFYKKCGFVQVNEARPLYLKFP